MPKFTLRLTDDEHAKLASAAALNRRSLQGEIIFRCFDVVKLHEPVDLIDGAGRVVATVPAVEDPHFKPHPKGKK